MKTKGKSKRGISLIVLVITIIVMIILAGAIILSLNSSGIIGRTNEARKKSDIASKKEAAGMFVAEYEMKLNRNEIDPEEVTLEDYIKQRMAEEGLDSSDVLVTEDGKVIVNPSGMQAEKAGVKIGATVVGYTVTEKSYTTSGKEVEGKSLYGTEYKATPAEISNKTDFNWIYIGNDKNGNMLIAPDVSKGISDWPTMTLRAQGGYLYGPDELNKACKKLYSTNKGTARSINIDDVNMILGYTGPKGKYVNMLGSNVNTEEALTIKEIVEILNTTLTNTKTPDPNDNDTYEDIGKYKSDYYQILISNNGITNKENISLVYSGDNRYWLASSCISARLDNDIVDFDVRVVTSGGVEANSLSFSNDTVRTHTYMLRPVVSIASYVQISYNADTNTCTIK